MDFTTIFSSSHLSVGTRCVPTQTELPHYLAVFSFVRIGYKINNLNEYIFNRFCKKAFSQLSPRLQDNGPKSHSALDPFQYPLEAFLTRIETGQCLFHTRGHEKIHQSYLWWLVKVFQQTNKVVEGSPHNNDYCLTWHCVHCEKSQLREGLQDVTDFGLTCWQTVRR